jgi:serine/threonine-protein kinase
MDLIADGDLAQRVRSRPLPTRAAAVMLHKIALAVEYAHREGVLHRDLKPSNVLLEGDEPRVADFGLAAQLEPGGGLTMATRVLGTPAYLAPEVFVDGSKMASVASDVYALGAILYELLTGRPPFFGAEDCTAALVIEREPVAPRLIEPGVPVDLETVCLNCLEKNRARR